MSKKNEITYEFTRVDTAIKDTREALEAADSQMLRVVEIMKVVDAKGKFADYEKRAKNEGLISYSGYSHCKRIVKSGFYLKHVKLLGIAKSLLILQYYRKLVEFGNWDNINDFMENELVLVGKPISLKRLRERLDRIVKKYVGETDETDETDGSGKTDKADESDSGSGKVTNPNPDIDNWDPEHLKTEAHRLINVLFTKGALEELKLIEAVVSGYVKQLSEQKKKRASK